MCRLRPILLGLLAVLAVSAFASASAFAVMPDYTNDFGNLISGRLATLSTTVGVTTLTVIGPGGTLVFQCEEERGTGWIENSATTGMGLSLALSHYLKCTMPKPGPPCKVKNGLIYIPAHGLLLLGGHTGFLDSFTSEGPNFTEITVEGCSQEGLNIVYPIRGNASALVNNTNLTLEFNKESGSNLKFGSLPVRYEDTVKVEMEGGGGIMVENGF